MKGKKQVAVEFYRKCPIHGIVGAVWSVEGKCPFCGKTVSKLTDDDIKDLEKYL